MKLINLGPSEIIFSVGFICFVIGIGLLYGIAWSLVAGGTILLAVAFRNAAEREKGK